MECECYLRNIQDLLAEGKTPLKGDSVSHSKSQLFYLVHCLNIILFRRKTSINLERKSYLVNSSACCTLGEVGKEKWERRHSGCGP